MLLDSTTNRYNIPPLHDLGVIVWLQGVAPTARWTAATSGASPQGEKSERGLTHLKTTQAVCCTANRSSAGNKKNKTKPSREIFLIANSNFGAYIEFRCYILIHSCFIERTSQYFQPESVENFQQVFIVALLSVCIHFLFPEDS